MDLNAMGALDRSSYLIEAFATDEQGAWAEVRRQHLQAMRVRDVEDLLSLGLTALRTWLRAVESWHTWVSEDRSRYQADVHERIRKLERMLVGATRGALEILAKTKASGFDVEYEAEFRKLSAQFLGAANPLEGQENELREAKQRAIGDASANLLESMECWGE